MSKQTITVDKEKLVNELVNVAAALAALQLHTKKPRPKPKHDLIDHLTGWSLACKLFK